MLQGYDQGNYTERALAHLEKDVCYLARNNWGYGMTQEDVAQELRLQLWRKLDQYDPHQRALRTWAQQVMRRKLMDMAKVHGRKMESRERVKFASEELLWLINSPRNTNQSTALFWLAVEEGDIASGIGGADIWF